MDKKCIVYDGIEVIDVELDAVAEKYGFSVEDLIDGNTSEEIRNKLKLYFKNEVDQLENDLEEEEPDSILYRIDTAVEDENGEVWLCVKLFNVNRWQKLFGTESE